MPFNSFEDYPMSWRPQIDKGGSTPLYLAIAGALEQAIRTGQLGPNDRLPPQRELADYLDVNLSTVTRAFRLCTAKGLIGGELGRGTFVASDVLANLPMLEDRPQAPLVDLGACHPLYAQNRYVTEALRAVVKQGGLAGLLEYAETAGRRRHRESGRRWLSRFCLEVDAGDILITAGLQNALAVSLTALFRWGDRIAVNAVTYPGVKHLAGRLGLRLVPVPFAGAGMDLAALRQLCRTERLKGIYLIPDQQNPTAADMGEGERAGLAQIIRDFGLVCLEDGTCSFLRREGRLPVTALVPERSVYISTVSNALSAGLRVAFVTLPPSLAEQLIEANRDLNVMAAPLEAAVAAHMIDSGAAEACVREKREELRRRNRLAEECLGGWELAGGETSQFRWLRLPRAGAEGPLRRPLPHRGCGSFAASGFWWAARRCRRRSGWPSARPGPWRGWSGGWGCCGGFCEADLGETPGKLRKCG